MKNYLITVNGTTYEVQVEELDATSQKKSPVPKTAIASVPKAAPVSAVSAATGKVTVKSPMPGSIVKINVSVGDTVKKGAVLCVLEAMKMENEIVSPEDGVIASVNTSKGASVNSGDILISLS